MSRSRRQKKVRLPNCNSCGFPCWMVRDDHGPSPRELKSRKAKWKSRKVCTTEEQ